LVLLFKAPLWLGVNEREGEEQERAESNTKRARDKKEYEGDILQYTLHKPLSNNQSKCFLGHKKNGPHPRSLYWSWLGH
jgi:hypothetical protein